ARLAHAPDTGLTSANSAPKSFLARSIAASSIWSMYLHPAYTLSPGQPSAYLWPRSDDKTSLTALDATFSLAIMGRLADNHLSCCFTKPWIFLNSNASLTISSVGPDSLIIRLRSIPSLSNQRNVF